MWSKLTFRDIYLYYLNVAFGIHQPSPHDFSTQSDNIVQKAKDRLPESPPGPRWARSKQSESCC